MHLHLLLYTWKLEKEVHDFTCMPFLRDAEDGASLRKVGFSLRIDVANRLRLLHHHACLHLHDRLPSYTGIFLQLYLIITQ
jgi:hypothetical protein